MYKLSFLNIEQINNYLLRLTKTSEMNVPSTTGATQKCVLCEWMGNVGIANVSEESLEPLIENTEHYFSLILCSTTIIENCDSLNWRRI